MHQSSKDFKGDLYMMLFQREQWWLIETYAYTNFYIFGLGEKIEKITIWIVGFDRD